MALPSVTSVFCSVHIWQKSWLDSCSQLQENTGSSSEEEEAEEEDVDVALKKEVAQLRASETKQERRFQALDSGANNVIFIRTQNIGKAFCSWCESVFQCFCLGFFFLIFVLFCFSVESDKLVHHILSDLHTTKKKKSRVILRMLPVSSLVASLDVHMRLNWCRIERCRRTVSRGVVESSEHSHDWSSKIVLLKWAIIWYWCIMTTTVKPLGFFSFFFQVTGTCKAFQEDMVKYLTTFLEPWFKTPSCATYQIAFKARNSNHNKRDEIIKSIAGRLVHFPCFSWLPVPVLKETNSFRIRLFYRPCGEDEP